MNDDNDPPILIPTSPNIDTLHNDISEVKKILPKNMDQVMDNIDMVETLERTTDELTESSTQFASSPKQVKCKMYKECIYNILRCTTTISFLYIIYKFL